MVVRTWWLAMALAVCASDAGAGGGTHTQITVWGSAPAANTASEFGGTTYGATPTTGALITEQREVDLAGGKLEIAGVASTIDAASVQLRSITDPTGVTVTEQRYVPGATTPDEILARHVGDTVTVVTGKGDVTGVLRAVDVQAVVVEVASDHRLQVLHRDGFVQDVRLPAGAGADKPSLEWRLAAKKPGKQTIEVSYRADGMTWSADYLAILDEAGKTMDFSAWASIKNATGASFDSADLALISGATTSAANAASSALRQGAPGTKFAVPAPVRLGNGETVQVELMPPRTGAKVRPVVAFEAMPDPSANFQAFAQTDCSQLNGGSSTPHADVAIEVDVPASAVLPDGKVRLFRRHADRLEVLSEDELHAAAGVARMRLANDNEITGDRHQVSCTSDERTRTVHEKIEVEVENKGKQAVDVVVREFLWRWPVWRIDPSEESVKGAHAGAQTQEYRLAVPAGGKKSVTYSVVYSW